MGWSWALVCACAFVLIFASSASEDGPIIEQREVTFDIDKILQEMNQPEPDLMQKEMDLTDLLDPIEMNQQEPDIMQKEVDLTEFLDPRGGSRAADPGLSQVDVTMDTDFTPRGRRPMFGPRSFGGPPMLDYRVQFPPGQPTYANLPAICVHGDRRPRYSDTYFPQSGFGQLKRRAEAVNNAESGFSVCCKGQQTWTQEEMLCCTTQAWTQAVESFCRQDTAVKDRVYHCCKQSGSDRLNCFQRDAPNPDYLPTEEVPVPAITSAPNFLFDPSTCQRTELTPHSVRGKKQRKPLPSAPQNVDISFPPGRPTAADIESLCRYRKLRPRYDLKCLPRKGYGWLARQSKTINRVERGFKQCCKRQQEVFTCADGKWREEMDRFCGEEKGGRMNFTCCEKAEGQERYDCFQASAPHPGYDVDLSAAPAATPQDPSLSQICDTHKIIKKKFSVGLPIQSFVNQCCPLSPDQKSSCITEKLVKMSESQCSARKPSSPAVRRCCRISSQTSSQCLSKILMDAISKATNASRQKKKKCPLS
ncbi:extracellular matrix protein 1 [Centroberyx gerrardi]|uniref:extracellular matrix protein 1-like n=1 Tax=Centroberyx gerrardi TaxID=166262 RepID=UPI003AAA311A